MAAREARPARPSDGILRIATNLLDESAQIIADIYRHRWNIELFFRFFKQVLGCRHLLSTARAGIKIQSYCAINACLLIDLWTGGKPSLRTYEMVCLTCKAGPLQDAPMFNPAERLIPFGHGVPPC